MARKKYNKKKESTRQRKFLRELKIPDGQVRERLLKQEDKELVLDQYEPIEQRDSDKRVILSKSDTKKLYEDLEYGIAINKQKVSNSWRIRRKIEELIDVVECHIYDTDDQLLKSTFVKRGEGWGFLNDGEKQFDSDTGKQKRYDRIVLEPHKTLKGAGFSRGKYRVTYNFHRNRLGSDFTFYIDPEATKSRRSRTPMLWSKDRVLTQDDGSVVVKRKNGKPTDKYLKTYQKKLFIQEISPSRTEIRALPVTSFCSVIDTKFSKEFTGQNENFELFDKKVKVIGTEDTGIFLTVDTYPESKKGNKKAEVGTSLVTISKSPTTRNRDVRKLFKFTPDMVGGVLTIPKKGISGVNTFDLYEEFEAEVIEFIDEQTVRVGNEFRQPTPIGDVNLDDKVNILDYEKLFSYIQGDSKLVGLAQFQADLDQDGKIDLADALWTLRIALQEVKKLGYDSSKGELTADRIFGVANDIMAQYKMTAAQRTIFDINRDGRIDNVDLLRFLERDIINVVTEITEVIRRPFKIEYENPYYDERKSLKYLLNFGDNERHLLTNWEQDSVTYPEYPHSIVLKLYEPLPKSIKQKSYFHIVEEITPSVIEDVVLTGEVEKQGNWKLRPPNWDNIDTKYVGKTEPIELSSWDDLLSTDSVTSQQLIDKYFSGSYDGTDLNIDYTEYENFVFFGSATERLANFKYKMQLLESYSGSISLESKISGSTTSVLSYKKKINDLRSSFDNYEKFLYYESGSVYTDSFGNHRNKTWPKVSTGSLVDEPYIPVKVDSNEGMDWYEEMYASASNFDNLNEHSLMSTLPIHIKENSENEEYFLFLDMVGQHYDTLWTYIRHLTNVTQRKEKVEEGIPRDLVYHIVKSMGHQLDLGTNVLDLWEYALGSDESGSFKYEGRESYEDVSKETWRRIANNLPYILKHKGTARSIKALLSCYGVPQTILKIREYGGPLVMESSAQTEIANYRKGSFVEDDAFLYAARFDKTQYVSGSWDSSTPSGRYPDSVELRFRTNETDWAQENRRQVVFQVGNGVTDGGGWSISTQQSGSSQTQGYVVFSISGSDGSTQAISSSKTTIFDNNYYNVMVRRNTLDDTPTSQTYDLFVKKFDDEYSRISYNSSASLTTSNAKLNAAWTGSEDRFYIGGSGSYFGKGFKGNIFEHRQWRNTLSEKAFENHTSAPQSYNGNEFYSSFDDMILRWKLDTARDYTSQGSATSSIVPDTKTNQDNVSSNPLKPGYAGNFSDTKSYDETYIVNKMITPNVGPNGRADNKIRIESNDLYYGNLSVNKRSERSSLDTAPLDSPKVGVYLSPGDLINDDIMRTFADIDFDSLIGDPRDQYRDNYPDLEMARFLYFRKFIEDPQNLSGYIDVVKLYDLSLFDQIKRLMPARSKVSSGVLIEPHILERPKVKWNKPSYEDNTYSGEIQPEPSESGEYIYEEGFIDPEPTVEGDTPNYDGETERPIVTEGEETSYRGEFVRPVETDGEETTYKGDPVVRPIETEGEETLYDGDSITENTLLEGEETLYDGEIKDKVLTAEGEETLYDGEIKEETITTEGDTKLLEDNIEIETKTLDGETKPLSTEIDGITRQVEGETKPYEALVEPVDEYTATGENIVREATWTNPHKVITSEYNRKEYVYETSSFWEGFQLVPKTVYTISGAAFPSHYPDVKGNPVRELSYMTEVYLPIYIDRYVPESQTYRKEEILMETSFNAGKYASSMKQKYGVGIENVGDVPKYFVSSSEQEFRGWYSGSNAASMNIPYFILDEMGDTAETSGSEEILLDEDGNYVIDGHSGSADSIVNESFFKRDGQPAVFEIREYDRIDKNNLSINDVETVQALYVENEMSQSSFNVSQSFWPFDLTEIPAPTDVQWELEGSRGFYSRFGTRGKFEFKQWEQYYIEFNIARVGGWNDNDLITVHLLEELDSNIDYEKSNKKPWGSQLIGRCYKTATFKKWFTPHQNGNFHIVFVIHGGVDDNNNAHNKFQFYLTNFKISHMEKADYVPAHEYSTAMKRLFYQGCLQTIDTTPDGEPPVEWTDTNPNVLVVDPSGDTELDVI